MDQTELGGDCCWRTIICEQALIVSYFNEQCNSILGKNIISTTSKWDSLRNTFCINKDSVLEYKVHDEEKKITFELPNESNQSLML